METFITLLVNGLVTGAIYALMALGFALIYNTTRVFHVAHGAVFTLAGYMAYLTAQTLFLAWLPAILVAMVVGAAIEVLVYRPIRHRGGTLETYFIAALGVYFVVQNILQLLFGPDARLLRTGPLPDIQLSIVHMSIYHLLVIFVAILIFALVQLFLVGTRLGKAIRALADNPGLARALGLDVDRLNLVIFLIGSGLAGASAYLLAIDLGVRLEIGLQVLLIAAIAVIFGGVGYLPGAIVGGFTLGIAQSLVVLPLSAQWQNVFTYALLILVLIFRPQGLFGARLATRRA